MVRKKEKTIEISISPKRVLQILIIGLFLSVGVVGFKYGAEQYKEFNVMKELLAEHDSYLDQVDTGLVNHRELLEKHDKVLKEHTNMLDITAELMYKIFGVEDDEELDLKDSI